MGIEKLLKCLRLSKELNDDWKVTDILKIELKVIKMWK